MTIYISGPMTGNEDFETDFTEAEANLKERYPNAKIINPVHMAVYKDVLNYDTFLYIDGIMLRNCDTIYLLKGWEDSAGSKLELKKFLLGAVDRKVLLQGDDEADETEGVE